MAKRILVPTCTYPFHDYYYIAIMIMITIIIIITITIVTLCISITMSYGIDNTLHNIPHVHSKHEEYSI